MSAAADYLAIDLGASSGRAVLGRFDGQRVSLEEVHRFPNGPVKLGGSLFWDAPRLFEEVETSLAQCTQRGIRLDGVGIDTWGVDFALLGRDGHMLELPRHYRDPRTRGVMERALARVPRAAIYEATGIQFMPLNTLYQLLAVADSPARLLDLADRLLFMPDLLAYWLTGERSTERSIASTSQMLNARTGCWDAALLERLELPAAILPPILPTGTPGKALLADVEAEIGQPGVPLIYTACHDTAAAVAAVPARDDNWAYISSGTWSLVGAELAAPVINARALAANFTNEAGAAGRTRFLRNVPGLWLVQECQRTWAAEGQPYSHEQLAALAAAAEPFQAFIDPGDARFVEPCDMPNRIRAVCHETGQRRPDAPGAVVRCVLESLALTYRVELGVLEQLTQRPVETIHIVGGGAQNELLNQFTADAAGRPVVAGPIEATAAGNILIQAMAQKRLASLEELREVVGASVALKRYGPRDTGCWQEAAARFETVRRGAN